MHKSLSVFVILTLGIVAVMYGINERNKRQFEETKNVIFRERLEEDAITKINLENKIVELRDSIAQLNLIIEDLNETIVELNEKNSKLERKLSKLRNDYDKIKEKIALIHRKPTPTLADRQQIASLEHTKTDMKREITYVEKKGVQTQKEEDKKQEEMQDQILNRTRMEKLSQILEQTTVEYKMASPRREHTSSREVTNINRDADKWKVSVVEFYLRSENMKAILDEKFTFEIFDIDNKRAIGYIENNPKFKDSDQRGYEFKFDGNLVEVSYYNSQEKEGKNYDLRVYYLQNGDKYLIESSVKPFFRDGKLVN